MLEQTQKTTSAGAGGLTDVGGLKVGHFTDTRRPTGCTVILAEEGAVAGVDVRGSAPGTRETDLLNPINSVQKVHAILLSGGSAFGLDAAGGVMQYLEEKGIGFETRVAKVPIVPAAILFDLGVGDPKIRPDRTSGYAACSHAKPGAVGEGNVGAGTGATVGKLLGPERAMKGGVGTASIKVGSLVVAALAAVNAVGDIYDPKTGLIIAGARTEDGNGFANAMEIMKKEPVKSRPPGSERHGSGTSPSATEFAPFGASENSTLAVVATNAALNKTAMTKIAQMAHDGYARAINPVHTPRDGDTVFALSTGRIQLDTGSTGWADDIALVGALAADVVAAAIVRAVQMAQSIPGFPAARDFKPR
ncbi:MAG TPA: P1 family peptidase [Acidobacteriota bacterium]